MSGSANPPYDENSTLQELVEQLELCNFKDELGHELSRNVAFKELKRRAENGHSYLLTIKSQAQAIVRTINSALDDQK